MLMNFLGTCLACHLVKSERQMHQLLGVPQEQPGSVFVGPWGAEVGVGWAAVKASACLHTYFVKAWGPAEVPELIWGAFLVTFLCRSNRQGRRTWKPSRGSRLEEQRLSSRCQWRVCGNP